MGDEKKEKQRFSLLHVAQHLADEGLGRQRPVPVPVHEADNRQRRVAGTQALWWELCVAWLRYQAIQCRWDIERGLARLFHRRWV